MKYIVLRLLAPGALAATIGSTVAAAQSNDASLSGIMAGRASQGHSGLALPLDLGTYCDGDHITVNRSLTATSGALTCTTDGGVYGDPPGSTHGYTGDATFGSDWGDQRALAQLTLDGFLGNAADIEGHAYMRDLFHFTSDLPTTIAFTITDSWSVFAQSVGDGVLAGGYGNSLNFGQGCSNSFFSSVANGTFTDTRTVSCTVTGDQLLTWDTSAYLEIYSPTGVKEILDGSGSVGAHASIDGIAFYDAEGHDISDRVTYTTASGTQYVTATPEPATITLMGTGLLAVFGIARRRKRMSAQTQVASA